MIETITAVPPIKNKVSHLEGENLFILYYLRHKNDKIIVVSAGNLYSQTEQLTVRIWLEDDEVRKNVMV